jgi:ribosomal protein S20
MANTKSAEKRSRQNTKKAASNRIYRSSARTAIKKARLAIESGDRMRWSWCATPGVFSAPPQRVNSSQ